MSRLQQLTKQGLSPSLPHPGVGEHLIGYLMEAGPTQPGGMGMAPLGWCELESWQRSTGIALQAWEARTLRRLSCEYVAAANDAADPACPAPYSTAPTPDQRELVSRQIRTALRGWGQRNKQAS